MTHLGTRKRPMPSAWSAYVYGPVRGMKPSLRQQWREVIAHFSFLEWFAGSALVLLIFTIGIGTAVVLNFTTGG